VRLKGLVKILLFKSVIGVLLSVCLFYSPEAGAIKYLGVAKAVSQILGVKKSRIKQHKRTLTRKEFKWLKTRWKTNPSKKPYKVYFAKKRKKLSGFAVASVRYYDKSCKHHFVIGVSPKLKVTEVKILELSCKEAYGINKKSFLGQFQEKGYLGKGKFDAIQVGNDIVAVTKATDSSVYVAEESKKALDIVRLLFYSGK